jgi:hypothetical protein
MWVRCRRVRRAAVFGTAGTLGFLITLLPVVVSLWFATTGGWVFSVGPFPTGVLTAGVFAVVCAWLCHAWLMLLAYSTGKPGSTVTWEVVRDLALIPAVITMSLLFSWWVLGWVTADYGVVVVVAVTGSLAGVLMSRAVQFLATRPLVSTTTCRSMLRTRRSPTRPPAINRARTG